MPRRLYTCTPTRLTTWLDCPRRYRMTYLDRPPPGKGPPWAHNSLGASVHNARAGWGRLPVRERTVSAAGELLERGWIEEGFADSLQSSRYRSWARGMVEAYVTGLDPASEPVGVERTVATRTELIAVSGRIDRLDDRREPGGSGDLVVVDYKTGRHVLTVDDARTSLPLALYALAAGRGMRGARPRGGARPLPPRPGAPPGATGPNPGPPPRPGAGTPQRGAPRGPAFPRRPPPPRRLGPGPRGPGPQGRVPLGLVPHGPAPPPGLAGARRPRRNDGCRPGDSRCAAGSCPRPHARTR